MFHPVLDAFFEMVSGGIAIVIAYEAAKARSFSKESIFLSFEISFALLGASSVLRALLVLFTVFTARQVPLVGPFSILGDLVQACAGMLAYAILLWVQMKSHLAGTSILLQVGFGLMVLSFNALNVFMLLAIATLVFVRFLRDRNANQALVVLGFLLLAFSHLSNMVGYSGGFLLPVENVLRLAGYLSLLAMLMRVRRVP